MTDQDDFSSSTPAEAGPLITPDDLANVEEFLIGRDFEADLGVATVPLSAAIRKPTKSEWIRTHPTFQRSMFVLKVRDSEARGETFLLSKAVAKLVPESATAAFLVLDNPILRNNSHLRQLITRLHFHDAPILFRCSSTRAASLSTSSVSCGKGVA